MKLPPWGAATLITLFIGALIFRRIVYNTPEAKTHIHPQPTIEKVGIRHLPVGKYVITDSFGVQKVENGPHQMRGLVRVSPFNNPSKQIDVEWYEPEGVPYIYNVGVIIEKKANDLGTIFTSVQ